LPAPSLRVAIGSAGLAGHSLPALALAGALSARGHDLHFFGFERWRELAGDLGLGFTGAEEQLVPGVAPGAELAETARALLGPLAGLGADVVVSDALTLAPGLAAEAAAVPRVTLYPEVYPLPAPGHPYFSLGLIAPRTPLGAALWRALPGAVATRLPSTGWLHASRRSLNRQRAELGLRPIERFDEPEAGLSLVATLPELEYPRDWPESVEVTGRMGLDLPGRRVEAPAGTDPLVLIAPSTVKDPGATLVGTALDALGGEPVRLLASTSGAPLSAGTAIPANAVVAEWVDYSAAIRDASLVVCHGNHGTVAQALAAGVPALVVPAMPDDAEHGARVAWSGAGLMVPRRLLSPRSLRLAVRELLSDARFAERAGEIATANADRDGAAVGAALVEEYAEARR